MISTSLSTGFMGVLKPASRFFMIIVAASALVRELSGLKYPWGEEIINHPYSITVFVPDSVKELHMDFVNAVFKHLFDKESEKAVSQFNRYIDLSAKTTEAFEDKLSLNGRAVRFYKVSGKNTFSVWIYSKK